MTLLVKIIPHPEMLSRPKNKFLKNLDRNEDVIIEKIL